MLWLRQVVQTGDTALIDKAMQAAERIKTKPDELEKRYGDFLMRESGGNTMRAVFGSIGFANLKGLAESTLDKQARKREALARFGSDQAVFATLPQEQFCMDALALVPQDTKGWHDFDQEQVNAAFAQQLDLVPHTLADCLHELDFWDALSEGVMMPLGALLMSLMIGWEIGPEFVKEETEQSGHAMGSYGFFKVCVKFITPLIMVLILYGQIKEFFL